jgi:RNA polymerase sigma-70 factor (ECF subfamily)
VTTDADLVRAARAGDGSAFVTLFERHRGAVRLAVRDRVRDRDQADELVQEAFTRVLERLPTLRQPDRFRPWLLAVARNVAVDRVRLERRQVSVEDAEALDGEDESAGPDELAASWDLVPLIDACLVDLSPRDVKALALVAELDLAPAEVARALGLTPGTAKVVVHRARRRLRTALVLGLQARDPRLACPAGAPGDARHVEACDDCVQAARRQLDGAEPVGHRVAPVAHGPADQTVGMHSPCTGSLRPPQVLPYAS